MGNKPIIDLVGIYTPDVIYRTIKQDDETVVQDKTYLYLGSDDKLYYPTATDFAVNACRAYFRLKNGLTTSPNPSEGGETNPVRAFVLNLDDYDATGINYVHNRKKVIIK